MDSPMAIYNTTRKGVYEVSHCAKHLRSFFTLVRSVVKF